MLSLEALGEKVREVIPDAVWGEDNDGQLIIYTNLQIVGDGYDVAPFEDGEPAH